MTGERSPRAGPQWFGSEEVPLFGWVHRPSVPGAGGVAVLCPPLFGEDTVAQFAYRLLARNLSAAGTWVVRFDYEGTGDSAGAPTGPGRVSAWLDSVDRAVALARSYSDGPLALGGMRMGALLAALAAERRGDVDALLLWDPCRSGRTFLRAQQALQAHRVTESGPNGVVEVPGYALDRATAEELGALMLPTELPARRALVLARPGEELDLRVGIGGPAGPPVPVEVRRTERGEQEALLEVEPLAHRVPTAAVAQATHWLGEALGSMTAVPVRRRSVPHRSVPALDGLHRPATTPVAIGVTRPGPQATVWERVVSLGDLGLFGIETQPSADDGFPPQADDRSPVVVLLSSGLDRHTGPSRLWVSLARTWASAGVRCVRVDLSGLGESPRRTGQAEEVLRPPEAFDDVLEVVAAVAADPRTVVLVGLCSGGYQALESALELAPRGVLAVNPLLRFTPPELLEGKPVSSRRRICVPKPPWVGSVRSRVPRRFVGTAVALRSVWARLRADHGVEDWFGELVHQDVQVYCICGEEEAAPLQRSGAAARAAWWASGHVRIEVIPGLDHALLPAAQREVVCARLSEQLRRVLGAEPGDVSPELTTSARVR